MAAGAWKDWAEGELVTEALFQDIQDSIAFIYASESAANTALTNKVEGTQFFDTTDDALKVWDGSAWQKVSTGITEADIWAVTANYTGDANPISSNWARYTDDGAGYIGTGMTQSSGIFTFPSTGIYKIDFNHVHQAEEGYDIRRVFTMIETTVNNSTYDIASNKESWVANNAQSGETFSSVTAQFLFDVTDTTTHKVRFRTGSTNTGRNINLGDSGRFKTGVIFTRLGDT